MAVGSDIYTIGGLVSREASSSVMVMDCRTHTWCEAPNMHVARFFQSACVLHGNIYVCGGSKDINPTNWMEVFDTKTQTWEFLQTPSEEIFQGSEYKSVRYQGTVFVMSKGKDATYKLHKGRWRAVDLALYGSRSLYSSYCAVDNVLYRYLSRTIDWYDSKERLWKHLKGLECLPHLSPCSRVKLVDFGGKLVVLWEETVSLWNNRLWCVEIAIRRELHTRDIWGKPEWFDAVSPTYKGCSLVHALVSTI